MRVVLDTNVVISAVLSPAGPPAQVLHAWRAGAFEVVVSEPILREYRQALGYPHVQTRHHLAAPDLDRIIAGFLAVAIFVAPRQHLAVVAEDPDDDRFLECALEGGAEYIVSGNKHLPRLKAYEGRRILAPAVFLALLAQET